MLSVPRALTSKSVSGSTSDVVTATCPARWRTASWSRTCSASALAFLTSSLMKVTRLGYRVISHFRLRSVPGRLKLSSRVTCQPSLIRWAAALTPRKPAPPLMSTRRSGPSPSRSTLSLAYRALGSIAADTLAGRKASEEGDRYDPRRARQDEGLAPGVVAARVGVRAGDEQGRESAVDHVQDPLPCVAAGEERGDAEQALARNDYRQDQVGRAKAAGHGLVAKVVVGAPQSEHDREDDQDASAEAVKVGERLEQSGPGREAGALLAEVVDRQPQPLLEEDLRPPPQLLRSAGVVEGDAVDVALARRPEARLVPVLGEQRELAKQVVDRDRDPGADVVGAAVAFLEGGDVGGRDVAHVQHVARLVAIAVDRDQLVLDHPAGEDRDHAALLCGEVLASAVDVGVAQGRESQAEGTLEHGEVLLEGELARAVGRKRADRVVLVGGHHVRLAVQRSAGGTEDDLAHAVVHRRAQDVEPAHDVHVRVVSGIRDRLRDLGLRRVVVDDLGPEGRHRPLHLVQIAHVGPEETRVGRHVLLAASAEVVEHRHLVPGGDIGVDDM